MGKNYYKAERTDMIRNIIWSSEQGRGANALALGAEEGRDKLRKATGSRK